jgi:outer membrane protein assembly factor BamB
MTDGPGGTPGTESGQFDRRTLLKTGTMAGAGLAGLSVTPAASAQRRGEDRLRWSFSTGERVQSSPTVVGGTVFVGSYDGNVYALDASDGTERWRFETGRPVASSPLVTDGTVYIGGGDGNVYALDASDGTEQWRFETDGRVGSSPTVVGGTVYIGSEDENVYALSTTDGTEQWRFDTSDEVMSSPTVADGTVYIGSMDSSVFAVDVNDGTEQWQSGAYESGGGPAGVSSSPTVADGTVYVGSLDGALYALSTRDGTERWRFQTEDSVLSSPTVADGVVYVGSADTYLYAIDASDGTERWFFEAGSYVLSSPTVADGTVYVGSYGGDVYALDADVSGSSDGSRVTLRTLGHHDGGRTGGSPPPEGDGQEPLPESFREAADSKRSLAADIDELAVYLAEEEEVEALLSTYTDDLEAGRFDDEQLATDAVRRLIFGERISKRLLKVTSDTDGIGNQQQVAVTTTEFVVKLAVSVAMLQVSISDLLDDSRLSRLVPDGEFLQNQLDGAFGDLVSIGFSEARQSEAATAITDLVDDFYTDSLADDYDTAEEFATVVEDSVAETAANLTLQRTVETGDGIEPFGSRLSVTLLNRLTNAEAGLTYLNEELSPAAVRRDGLAGTDQGMRDASVAATDQLDRVASTAETFLNELEARLEFVNILENVYELGTGVQEGEPVWRVAGLIATVFTKAGLAVATVRAVGTYVGRFTIQALMTIHARGIVGVRRGEPVTLDDVTGALERRADVSADVSAVDERWDADLDSGAGGAG